MVFSKSFPKTKDKYPVWEEVFLSDEEEKEVEGAAKKENIKLMKGCIDEAKKIFEEQKLKPYQSDIIRVAISLFEKQSSHQVYWKENKAHEKFIQAK